MTRYSNNATALLLLFAACWTAQPTAATATTAPDAGVGSSADDAEVGASLAAMCSSCHALESGGKKEWGPNLFGVFDRPVGAEVEYRYGPYLRDQNAAGATWDEASLREWLVDSKGVARAKGSRTKMPAQQLTEEQLDDIILYFQTLR